MDFRRERRNFKSGMPDSQWYSLNLHLSKELYTGTPNSDIRILFTVHCVRNVNKLSAPTEVEWKGLKL